MSTSTVRHAGTVRQAGVAAQAVPVERTRRGEGPGAVLFLADPSIEFTSGAVLDLNGASHLRI